MRRYSQCKPIVRGCLFLVVIAFGLLILLVVTRRMWLPIIGEYLVVSDPLQPADAIVVLSGGGPERVVQGAELFNEGYASWFVVTNFSLRLPGLRVRYSDLMKTEAESHGIPENQILTAPRTIKTTYEEAKAVKELADTQGFKSLIVVTDRYHTRRARTIFRDVFKGSGITITVRPVDKRISWYQADRWWKTPDGLRETSTEYLKALMYLVGYH